ncbi:dirigent protein 19-like [Malania oleifera]|uniref:dirigent protein 19-like n=1 Tax=Malania oleifera TaxID=397392 RepID=UPI0025ADA8F6|nr:dirigent protein 19-like [Malania oleifera]
MAKFHSFLFIFSISLFISVSIAEKNDKFVEVKKKGIRYRSEKISVFEFYWHDIVSGLNRTSMTVVHPASNATATRFGLVNMIDNPLTVGPGPKSKLIGRAQGFYALASQEQVELLMAMNFVFVEGKYCNSTITVLGRNPVFDTEREMPVIGGSGLFRFARGYVKLKTHDFNPTTRDVVVKYIVRVLHFLCFGLYFVARFFEPLFMTLNSIGTIKNSEFILLDTFLSNYFFI